MRRPIALSLLLAGSLMVAGCQNPDGSTDWGSTAALGAGIGLAAGLAAASASDNDDRRYRRRHYQRRDYGYHRGPRYGYHRGHW